MLVYLGGQLLRMPSAWFFWLLPWRHPLIPWLWNLKACTSGSHGPVKSDRWCAADYHSQGTAQTADWSTPIISEKEIYFLVQQPWPKCSLLVRHTPGGVCSQWMEAVQQFFELSLLPCYSSQYLLEGRLYTHLESWFSDCHLGDTSRSPGVVARSDYICIPTGLYIFAYFKSHWLRALYLRLFLCWNTDKSWHTLNNWS